MHRQIHNIFIAVIYCKLVTWLIRAEICAGRGRLTDELARRAGEKAERPSAAGDENAARPPARDGAGAKKRVLGGGGGGQRNRWTR